MYAFVLQQLDRRIRSAQEMGDELARAFAQGSRRVVEGMEQHLADEAAPAELRRFLVRAAHPHRHHPDFRFEWMLHADGSGASPGREYRARSILTEAVSARLVMARRAWTTADRRVVNRPGTS